MLLTLELVAGLAAASGVILNNSELFKNKKSKKEDNSDDLDPSELSYPDE